MIASAAKQSFNVDTSNPNKSFIKSIMKYYDDFTIPPTKYGLAMELIARKDYINQVRNNHQNLTVEETGLFVSKEFSFLGASHDGLVHCTCHGRGLTEIKCPSNHKESLEL